MNAALAFTRPPHALLIEPIVRHALLEDLGRAGDITSELTVPVQTRSSCNLAVRSASSLTSLALLTSVMQALATCKGTAAA